MTTFVGTPLAAFVIAAAIWPGGVPKKGASIYIANGLGIAMVAGRTRSIVGHWNMFALAGDTELTVQVKQAACIFTLLGAIARAIGTSYDSCRYFWLCNRLLAAYNGLIIALSAIVLRYLEHTTITYLPGTVLFEEAMIIALGLLMQAAVFNPKVRWAISKRLSTLVEAPPKISVASPPVTG